MFTGNHIISRSYENHSIIILLTVYKNINKQLCVIKQENCQILWWVDRHLGKKSFESNYTEFLHVSACAVIFE